MPLGQKLKVKFGGDNLKIVCISLNTPGDANYSKPFNPHNVWVDEEMRRAGVVTLPAEIVKEPGSYKVIVSGENRYGRLTKSLEVKVTPATGINE